jgi:hypothetical protein
MREMGTPDLAEPTKKPRRKGSGARAKRQLKIRAMSVRLDDPRRLARCPLNRPPLTRDKPKIEMGYQELWGGKRLVLHAPMARQPQHAHARNPGYRSGRNCDNRDHLVVSNAIPTCSFK